MALKTLMLGSKLDKAKAALEELRKKDADFETREAELAKAIEEAKDAGEEEQKTVEEAVDAFTAEKETHDAEKAALEKTVSDLEHELETAEAEQRSKAKPAAPAPAAKAEERKDDKPMNTRTKFFGMTLQERDAFFANAEVKEFLSRARDCIANKRAITGVGLLIPTVMLELLHDQIDRYSKLMRHVRVRPVSGTARQRVMGDIPEAVWTEMCATLNELTLSFSMVEMDGYKVGGYFVFCNAILEDNDVNLASEIIDTLGQAIGRAVDKAILYGTGIKMPLGIVTRLAQTAKPETYPDTARPWADLHTSNIKSIAGTKTGAALYQEILKASGAAKRGAGEKFWVMSAATLNTLTAEALSINASGAIVSGMNNTMPIVGGAVETLEDIPDNIIIGGYGSRYLLAERAGTAISQSEHVRFIEDQTVFKGTARYDGMPVIPEAFVAIGINGATVSANAVTFAPDTANALGAG